MNPRPDHITIAQLRRRLIAEFGTNRVGNPNLTRTETTARGTQSVTYAVFGVGPATVRRWLAGPSPRSRSTIPVEQLHKLQAPAPDTMTRETLNKKTRAESALTELAHRPLTARSRQDQPLHSWLTQGWLDEHQVSILSLPTTNRRHLRQVTVTRTSSARKMRELSYSGRRVVQFVTVPTYFHAQLIALEVMAQVDAARTRAGAVALNGGDTRTWDGSHVPAPDLVAVKRSVTRRFPMKPFRKRKG